ncbi:hypothetical protein [Methanogenium sp. MK-MG]|uniref:hypothetical protein n=1 Tax=Methanogenium sp. MK-MG TaxID=2599926 RepID=UPI0013EAB036|nr:hypothetical protein [Methanogenium sp. MK-MG]KAF1075090.1 hypothetical protein MKMG_01800 [Methanogenium sp. MK-MG]
MVPQLLCEGIHDGIFLEELFKVKNPGLYSHRIDNDISKFARIFRNPNYWSKCSVIIQNDNGHDLISKFLPRIIQEFFMRDKNRKVINFYVLKDSDGEDTEKLINSFHKSISESLNSKRYPEFNLDKFPQNKKIIMNSLMDDRYKFCFQFIFVPISFEEKIREKALAIYSTKISNSRRDAIIDSDPHDALNLIANELELDSKENLIRNSAKEFWFKEEEWYKQIYSVI